MARQRRSALWDDFAFLENRGPLVDEVGYGLTAVITLRSAAVGK